MNSVIEAHQEYLDHYDGMLLWSGRNIATDLLDEQRLDVVRLFNTAAIKNILRPRFTSQFEGRRKATVAGEPTTATITLAPTQPKFLPGSRVRILKRTLHTDPQSLPSLDAIVIHSEILTPNLSYSYILQYPQLGPMSWGWFSEDNLIPAP